MATIGASSAYDSDSSEEFILGGVTSIVMEDDTPSDTPPPPPPTTTKRLESLIFSSLPVPPSDPSTPYDSLINDLANGAYLKMLTSNPLPSLLLSSSNDDSSNDDSSNDSEILSNHDPFTSFLIGIAAFNIYLQSNYTGPSIETEVIQEALKKITGEEDVDTNR